MFASLLLPLGIKAAKFIGVHALPHIPIINRIPGVAGLAKLGGGNLIQSAEGAAFGLGGRFFLGLGAGFYLLNPQFRKGADLCIAALKDAALSALGGLF